MGFVFTLLYIIVAIVSPDQFGPHMAEYHILAYIAAVTAVVSLPNMVCGANLKSSLQAFLLIGFIAAIGVSEIANRWLGGVIVSWQSFLPSAAMFFFILVNVTNVRRVKVAILVAIASCIAVVVEGLCGYYGGFGEGLFVLHYNLYSKDEYIIGQVLRLRGAGSLSDPNDFAQILVVALPLVFVGWQHRRNISNIIFVMGPAALLFWGTYLTHSRGALLALAAIVLFALRNKLGTTVSTFLAVTLLILMLGLDFTGGRGISAAEGADRIGAWASGLELFKGSPLFGIGFHNFTDFNDITAHNSFILCLAELGLLGSTLWVALLVTTTLDLNRMVADSENVNSSGTMQIPEEAPFGEDGETASKGLGSFFELAHDGDYSGSTSETLTVNGNKTNVEPKADGGPIPKHWVEAIRLSLIGFMITGWFLSRSYQITLYLILGLASAAIAIHSVSTRSRSYTHWPSLTLVTELCLIVVLYGAVRLFS